MQDFGASAYLNIKVVLSDGNHKSHKVYFTDLEKAAEHAAKLMKAIDDDISTPVLRLINPNVSYNTSFVVRVEFDIEFEGEQHPETANVVQQEFTNRTMGFRVG